MSFSAYTTPRRQGRASFARAVLGIAALATAAPVFSAMPRSVAPHYRLTEIRPTTDMTGCVATGVNDSGQVSGYWQETGMGAYHAFRRDANGGLWTLPELPGMSVSAAWAINDAGEVIGASGKVSGGSITELHAVLWDAARSPHDLGTLGGSRSAALGINNATATHGTQVVGASLTPGGVLHPFLWDSQAGMRDLAPAYPADAAVGDMYASAINDSGEVTGTLYHPLGSGQYLQQAFRWDAQAGVRFLGTGAEPSRGDAINAAGQVVGTEELPGGAGTGLALWDAASEQVRADLTPAAPRTDFAGLTRRASINTVGEIAFISGPLPGRAWLLSGGAAVDLNTIVPLPDAYVLTSATSINNRGQITGEVLTSDGPHAYLLTPAAETQADVSVELVGAPAYPVAGHEVTYLYAVRNRGLDVAGVTFTDMLPGSATFVGSTPPATPAGGQLTLNLGRVAPGTVQFVTVTVRAEVVGPLTNSVSVTGSEPDPRSDNNQLTTYLTVTETVPQTDLFVTMNASRRTVPVTKPVTFIADIRNQGPKSASHVTLTPAIDGAAQKAIRVGTLRPGQSVKRSFKFKPTAAGTINVTATASALDGDGNPADNQSRVSITVQAPAPHP